MIKISLLLLFIFIGILVNGQDMLIEQIAGKKIIRKAFNDDKELISRQVFIVGELQTNDKVLTVDIEVNLFDEENTLDEKYFTQYTCNPDKSDVILAVFPFARNRNAEYMIETTSTRFKKLYDFNSEDKTLNDLSISMSIESGVLSFFGSTNILTFTNRILIKNEDGFKLKSTLTIEAYLWGVKVKTKTFQLIENFDHNRILNSQLFRTENEGYFMVHYP
ncbi:MAG: hypothetical protein COA32_05605 [Fluviicola sp.]|nr:MAG: hypothetical protein COA32_05605 [Fluviicola sp.]